MFENIRSKKNSFIFNITTFAIVYMILMISILSAIWVNTSVTLEKGAGTTLTQAVSLCSYELDEVMLSNEQALYTVLQNNENIQVFESGTENERAVATQNMLQLLRKATLSGSAVQNLFFYDLIGETYLATASDSLTYTDTQEIEKRIRSLKEELPGNAPSKWFCQRIGDKIFFLRLYKNKKRMLGALVEAGTVFGEQFNEKLTMTLTDEEGSIIQSFGDNRIEQSAAGENGVFASLYMDTERWTPDRKFYLTGKTQDNWGFKLFAGMPGAEVYGNYQRLQIIILILVFFAIIVLAGVIIYTRRVVYKPLMDLLSSMKQIESGDQEHRLSADAESDEFRRINSSFNRMMDTILNLKLKSYEERIQFDEATLKYVQLQIKPHFFLNALTTIHSMSYQNRNEDIRDYIEKLSENVRYLFKSGMHTVPLSEEIAHVKNYIAMQDMLYPGCVFDFIDIDDDLMDYPIPQLIVHTILENIYKHAVSVDKLTSILISAKEEERDGELMCHITVEDDGDGYPDAFLQQVKEGNVRVQENGHGVGLWNLKKTLELMYRKEDLIAFSNKQPNGSRTEMWIPRRVKRQSRVWKL